MENNFNIFHIFYLHIEHIFLVRYIEHKTRLGDEDIIKNIKKLKINGQIIFSKEQELKQIITKENEVLNNERLHNRKKR